MKESREDTTTTRTSKVTRPLQECETTIESNSIEGAQKATRTAAAAAAAGATVAAESAQDTAESEARQSEDAAGQ